MYDRMTIDQVIQRVAKNDAQEFLERELDKKNLPLPRASALDVHLDEIVRRDPRFLENARKKVEAQQISVTEILAQISGKEPPDPNGGIELEF